MADSEKPVSRREAAFLWPFISPPPTFTLSKMPVSSPLTFTLSKCPFISSPATFTLSIPSPRTSCCLCRAMRSYLTVPLYDKLTSQQKEGGRPESPTTARELDFDDDEPASHPQTPAKDVTHASTAKKDDGEATASTATATTAAAAAATNTTSGSSEPAPPQPPPKEMSPREQAELTLQEAFPSIEGGVVRAVLAASGGQVEPAFNALLGMTDPESAARTAATPTPPPPPQPPRPQVVPQAGAGADAGARGPPGGAPPKSQLEADELYARQLAEHYQRQDARHAARYQQQQQRGQAPGGGGTFAGHQQEPYYDDDRERNFIDDDLPEIGENIRKGFLETQQKFSGWLNTLKKKMDGDDDDEHQQPPRLPARGGQASGAAAARRSHDYDRYDADPEEFGNDFTKLQLRDETASPPKQPPRRANPDLFKPTPATPHEGGAAGGRRVSFQDGPPEEIGGASDASKTGQQAKSSKWQPLSTVEPSPEADHDPFSLGDSDDDEANKGAAAADKNAKAAKDSSAAAATTTKKSDDSELLAKATAEAMAGEIGDDSGPKLELKDNEGEGKK